MSVLLQTNEFRFNKDEIEPYLRFPDLATNAYSFNIQINNNFYIVLITYNIWSNSPQVSIYDSNQNAMVLNVPLMEQLINADNPFSPNYLYGNLVFEGYTLVWNIDSQEFLFIQL